jgi:hypothetical protein
MFRKLTHVCGSQTNRTFNKHLRAYLIPGVALPLNGSSSICGLLTVNKRKESSAQQFSSGTTIHLALQSFEPTDLTLGLSITPALRNGIPDSCKVIANRVGESTESVQARSVSIVKSLREN